MTQRHSFTRIVALGAAAAVIGIAGIGSQLATAEPSSAVQGSAASTLSCPYDGSYTAPAAQSWKVDSAEVARDASGAELKTFAGYTVSQMVVQDGNTTYIGYFDEQKRVTVAVKGGNGAWTVRQLSATLEYDSHSNITLAIDQNKNLHVVAKTSQTDIALKYWVTTVPGNLSTLAPSSMISWWGEPANGTFYPYESMVSYPRFYTGKDGQLFFRYQAGSAGGAWTIVYQFNGSTKQWELMDPATGTSGLAKVFAGWNSSPAMSAYPSVPEKGPDGNFHMVWTWRGDPSAGTNSQIHYAYSADMRTWKNIRGEVVTNGQFVYNQAQTMVDNVPQHGGILNDTAIALGFDGGGKVVVSYVKYVGTGDAKTSQLFTARSAASGAGWTLKQVSNWSGLYDLESRPGAPNGDMSVNVLNANSGAQPSGGQFVLDYVCQNQAHRMVIDSATGNRVADIAIPGEAELPAQLTSTAFTGAGYKITHRQSWAYGSNAANSLVLKWEAGPYIVDDDYEAVGRYPTEGSPLTIVRMHKG